jgi:hypothetical protein
MNKQNTLQNLKALAVVVFFLLFGRHVSPHCDTCDTGVINYPFG